MSTCSCAIYSLCVRTYVHVANRCSAEHHLVSIGTSSSVNCVLCDLCIPLGACEHLTCVDIRGACACLQCTIHLLQVWYTTTLYTQDTHPVPSERPVTTVQCSVRYNVHNNSTSGKVLHVVILVTVCCVLITSWYIKLCTWLEEAQGLTLYTAYHLTQCYWVSVEGLGTWKWQTAEEYLDICETAVSDEMRVHIQTDIINRTCMGACHVRRMFAMLAFGCKMGTVVVDTTNFE